MILNIFLISFIIDFQGYTFLKDKIIIHVKCSIMVRYPTCRFRWGIASLLSTKGWGLRIELLWNYVEEGAEAELRRNWKNFTNLAVNRSIVSSFRELGKRRLCLWPVKWSLPLSHSNWRSYCVVKLQFRWNRSRFSMSVSCDVEERSWSTLINTGSRIPFQRHADISSMLWGMRCLLKDRPIRLCDCS